MWARGFFDVDVESLVDGPQCGRGVVMVGGTDNHRVDAAGFGFDHLAIIHVGPSILESGLGAIEVIGVDVTQGNDVLALDTLDVGGGTVGRANTRDSQFLVGGPFGRGCSTGEHTGGNGKGTSTGGLQEVAAVDSLRSCHVSGPLLKE